MDERFARELEDRLIRYARIDTQSDELSPASPRISRQHDLLRLLVDELQEIGARDMRQTSYGTVLETIPATSQDPLPTIGFLAHVDTVPGFSETDVKPIVHRGYDGGDIVLPDTP